MTEGYAQPDDDSRSLRILITNITLATRTGTEIFTRDMAFAMQRLGHTPIVYTQSRGPIANDIAARGISVTTDIRSISGSVDVIHGHHHSASAIAVARFPLTPAIFVCHDFTAWHDHPPALPSIRRYVAIGRTSAERLLYTAGIAPDRVKIIPNGIDFDRFQPGADLPEHPARALAFCRSLDLATAIRQACRLHDIDVDIYGEGVGRIADQPEELMPLYDIVFASGLTAREALTCRRGVVCCDNRGLAGFVTPERFKHWRSNLGLRVLTKALTVANLSSEIAAYDAAAALAVSETFRRHGSMDQCARQYLAVYRSAMEDDVREPLDEIANATALAAHLQLYSPNPDTPTHRRGFWPWIRERDALLARLRALEPQTAVRPASTCLATATPCDPPKGQSD